MDFKVKMLTVGGKRLKLTIWDTGNNKMEPFYYMLLLCSLLIHTPLRPKEKFNTPMKSRLPTIYWNSTLSPLINVSNWS